MQKKKMLPFNVPPYTGKELDYLTKAVGNKHISGNGEFTKKCNAAFEKIFSVKRALMTTSCSHALEMAALLCGIEPGDEVIMPSYTFPSTANAFVLRGAIIVFVDIRKDTMNVDEKLIEPAITDKTKVIVPVHYAGVSCEMDEISAVADKHDIRVVEDAAQGMMAAYKGRPLGSMGHLGCVSFHETKNYSCGEGGALLIRDENYIERAEIIIEKGTNRKKFFRGEVDKYTWVDVGSSYLPSDMNAAYLWAQLEMADEIKAQRLKTWDRYYNGLKNLEEDGLIELPFVPRHCMHNGHMFYIKAASMEERDNLIKHLNKSGYQAIFHYIPLHSSPAGLKFGRFCGEDINTTSESGRLLRLPMYFGIKEEDVDGTITAVLNYYKGRTL